MPVGTCHTPVIAEQELIRPSACEALSHTYYMYCRMGRHRTICLLNHVTHLLLQDETSPNQVAVGPWAPYQIRKIAGCACARNAWNIFPVANFKGSHKLAIPACITHVPLCMSLTGGGGENDPGIPDACAICNFAYLTRGPCYTLLQDGVSRACGTILQTYYCRMGHHYAKCLTVTHLLLHETWKQVPLGPYYTLTIADGCTTWPRAYGPWYKITNAVWDITKQVPVGSFYALLQDGASPDHVPVGPCYTLLQDGASPDHVAVGPRYTLTIPG